MDIKTFRKLFAEKVLEQIGNEGFLYKSSRELFIKTEENINFLSSYICIGEVLL